MSPALPLPRFRSLAIAWFVVSAPCVSYAQPARDPGPPSPAAATPKAPTSGTRPPETKPSGTRPAPAPAPAASTASPSPSGDSWVSGTPAPAPSASAGDRVAPPPVYYVESVPNGPPPEGAAGEGPTGSGQQGNPPDGNQLPMRLEIEEPPPPVVARHRSPRNSFWLGARGGLWVPFGDLWGACNSAGMGCKATRLSTVAASGPMLELDIGARINRNYNIYALWERAQLGRGSGDAGIDAAPTRAETDYFALGVRLSTDPDDVGMLLDLSIGARRMRTFFEGDQELQLSQALLESRLGVGADIRLSRTFSLSPMLTLGLGSFGKAEWVNSSTVSDAIPAGNDTLTHGWLTLHLGGHFDIAGSR